MVYKLFDKRTITYKGTRTRPEIISEDQDLNFTNTSLENLQNAKYAHSIKLHFLVLILQTRN